MTLIQMHSKPFPYLAAVLFGAVRAADRRGGYCARELGVGAQHGVWLSWASWTEFANARWELSPWMVLQNMGFSLAGTFVNLQIQCFVTKAAYGSTFLL